MAQLQIQNLTYTYPDCNVPALQGIDLDIQMGEFILILGESGSGKSTLARAIAGLVPEFYGGILEGAIQLKEQSLLEMNRKEVSETVGIVFQDPESQLVMNGVEEELAFGLENLGVDNRVMKRRIMETRSALNISAFSHRRIAELSGGQKQKIALGSILAMQPEILILDEPTSQLDPIAGEDILTMVRRLNEENGITVILTEQRLERCFHLADRILVMSQGKLVQDTQCKEAIARWALDFNKRILPPVVQLFTEVNAPEIPVTVKDGRKLLNQHFEARLKAPFEMPLNDVCNPPESHPLLAIENVWFAYEQGQDILKKVSLSVDRGQCFVIMGENGGGKSTLLKMIRGLLKPNQGTVRMNGSSVHNRSIESASHEVGYLSQNPNDYLFLPTVEEELRFTMKNLKIEDETLLNDLLDDLGIEKYRRVHPRDLSTGERQRAALASVLVSQPELLLLDEPTRGLDYELKEKLGDLILQLKKQGKTVILVTHDVEFAAEYGDRVALIDDGMIISEGSKNEMLSDSTFYSPQIGKLFHYFGSGVVTLNQAKMVLGKLMTRERKVMEEKRCVN